MFFDDIIKHWAFFKTFISPINIWWILMKFRKDIPVLHAYFLWKSTEHRSNVKVNVIKDIKTTVWAITFEPEVAETSVFFWKFYWCKYLSELSQPSWHTYRFCVTWRQIKPIRNILPVQKLWPKVFVLCFFVNLTLTFDLYYTCYHTKYAWRTVVYLRSFIIIRLVLMDDTAADSLTNTHIHVLHRIWCIQVSGVHVLKVC